MSILITGGAGFIGRHVIDALAERELPISLIVDSFEEKVHGKGPFPDTGIVQGWKELATKVSGNPTEALKEHMAKLEAAGGVLNAAPYAKGDITCFDRMMFALTFAPKTPITTVVHLAGAVSVSDSFANPTHYIWNNVFGTSQLWRAILTANAKGLAKVQHVVYASSMANYGEGMKTLGITEDHPMRPLNTYGLSKKQAEEICSLNGELNQIGVTNLRFWNVYGRGQSIDNAETGVVPIWLNQLLTGKRQTVFEDGKQTRDFVHVSDVAAMVAQAVKVGPDGVRSLNVGSGVPTPVIEVADYLAGALDKPRPEPLHQDRPGDSRHCWPDVSEATRVLEYRARMPLSVGLSDVTTWAKEEFERNLQTPNNVRA